MFRRKNQTKETAPRNGSSGMPLGDAGAIWYKAPASQSTNNAVPASPTHRNLPGHQDQQQQQQYQQQYQQHNSGDTSRRHSSPFGPLHGLPTTPYSSDSVNTFPESHPHPSSHHRERGSNLPPSNVMIPTTQHSTPSSNITRSPPRPKQEQRSSSKKRQHPKTTQLIKHLLAGNEWGSASQCIDQDPKCARFKEPVTILGYSTTVYPLHVAIVMNPPMLFLEKLCDAYPLAAHMADEVFGRMPLHWACMAGASTKCIEKLIQLYPTGPRILDKAQGRLPLHYIVGFATEISQVTTVLDSEPRGVKSKDSQSKTPVDLANSTTNPLKVDILAQLRMKRVVDSKKSAAAKTDTGWQNPTQDILSSATPSLESDCPDIATLKIPNVMIKGDASLDNQRKVEQPPMSGGFLFHQSRKTRNGTDSSAGGTSETSGVSHRTHQPSSTVAVDGRFPISGERKKPPPDSTLRQSSHEYNKLMHQRPQAHQGQHFLGAGQASTDEALIRNYADEVQWYSERKGDHAHGGGVGKALGSEMNGNIITLKGQISDFGQELRLKHIQLTEVGGKLDAMNSAERELTEELMQAQKAKEENTILLKEKQSHAAKIGQKIAELQDSLAKEEASIQSISGSIASCSKSAGRVEATLKNYQAEKGKLNQVRGALEEEKSQLDRSMSNCNAELKSLEAIQKMTMRNGKIGPDLR